MNTLESFKNDAGQLLADWGEAIEYRKHGATPRLILALVDRHPAEAMDRMGGVLPTLVVTVLNDAEKGMVHDEIDFANDRIAVPDSYGGAQIERAIMSIVRRDDIGMLALGLAG